MEKTSAKRSQFSSIIDEQDCKDVDVVEFDPKNQAEVEISKKLSCGIKASSSVTNPKILEQLNLIDQKEKDDLEEEQEFIEKLRNCQRADTITDLPEWVKILTEMAFDDEEDPQERSLSGLSRRRSTIFS